jgi:SAM-dependent methyltransferase
MFDATLNGVLDSADTATDLILSDVIFRRRAQSQPAASAVAAGLEADGIDNELTRNVFEGSLLADILSIAYGVRRGAKILSIGPGSAAMVAALRALGFEAWGVDSDCDTQGAPRPRSYNLVGDMTDLPFRDGYFDVVIERGLCCLPRDRVASAVMELRRVVRRGLILGSVTTDLAIDLLERYDLIAGVTTLTSRWDWSDMMFAQGFDYALADPARLVRAWKRAEESGAGPGHWYEDADALRYCIYQVTDLAAERHESTVVALPRRDIASRDSASHEIGSDSGGHDDDRAPIFASRAAVSS